MWLAGNWQREYAAEWAEWRSSASSLGQEHLATLCDAVTATVRYAGRPADMLASRLPEVLSSCDDLAFGEEDQVLAYVTLHLADRYGRVTQVLERIFAAGHLPIRRRGVRILEVGAGPAPGLYATRDFYDDLRLWVHSSGKQVDLAPVAVSRALDRGPAWGWLLHMFSEQLVQLRSALPGESGALPFDVSYPNLTGFSVPRLHVQALEAKAAHIEREFDEGGEDLGRGGARQLAQEEGVPTPSAYDLVIMCNFITRGAAISERYQKEISGLARSLTPGGLIVVLGSASQDYNPIWDDFDALMNSTPLKRVAGFEEPLKANPEASRAALISGQIHRDLVALGRNGGLLPPGLIERADAFPLFRAFVWKSAGKAARRRQM
jgi:hypothetical protein